MTHIPLTDSRSCHAKIPYSAPVARLANTYIVGVRVYMPWYTTNSEAECIEDAPGHQGEYTLMDRRKGRKPLIKLNIIFRKLRRILLEPLGRILLPKGKSAAEGKLSCTDSKHSTEQLERGIRHVFQLCVASRLRVRNSRDDMRRLEIWVGL